MYSCVYKSEDKHSAEMVKFLGIKKEKTTNLAHFSPDAVVASTMRENLGRREKGQKVIWSIQRFNQPALVTISQI